MPRNLKIANCKHKRYTNLIGEVQVKDEKLLNNIVSVILNNLVDKNRALEIMQELNINLLIIKL